MQGMKQGTYLKFVSLGTLVNHLLMINLVIEKDISLFLSCFQYFLMQFLNDNRFDLASAEWLRFQKKPKRKATVPEIASSVASKWLRTRCKCPITNSRALTTERSLKRTETFVPFTSIFVNRPLQSVHYMEKKTRLPSFYNNDNTLPMGITIKTYQNAMAMSISKIKNKVWDTVLTILDLTWPSPMANQIPCAQEKTTEWL